MKKRNLLLSLAAVTTLFAGALNVGAKGLDANTCKDGVVYTNYYYFLAAQVYQDGYDYGNDLTATLETRASYTNNIILVDAAKEKGIFSTNGINKDHGVVPITNDATSADGISNVNIVDFYKQYLKADDYASGAYKDGETIARMVKRSWSRVENGTVWPQLGSASVTEKTAEAFAKASLKLASGGLNFGEPGIPAGGNYATDLSINIIRNYSGATSYYSGSDYVPLTDSTDSNKKWWVQPALYYIQYCEAGTGATTTDGDNKPTEAKEYTVSYNPNKGVNAPAAVTADASKNACVTIADAGNMNRTGYKFVGWNTSDTATTKDKDFEPGAKYCGPTNVTLYAVWAAENPETGVNAHVLAFGVAVIAAGAALVVARKKGLFKQI